MLQWNGVQTLGETMKISRDHAFDVLHIRAFRLYFFGQMISISGTWMQRVAQGWLVYHLTGSPFSLGFAAFATGVPAVLLMPFAGVWADRTSRRHLLLITQVAELMTAFVLGVLVLTQTIQFYHVVVCALVLGVTTAIGEPARQSFMKEMTGPTALHKGLALNALMVNAASVIGPAIAGVMLLSLGAGWCFVLNGLSYLAVIASLLSIHVPQPAASPGRRSPLHDLKEGVRYIQQHAQLPRLLKTATLVNILGIGALQTLLPAFAADTLHDAKIGYALLTATIGVGAVAGAAAAVPLGNRFGRTTF
ncbi:MFS transporter [bacterium]|nr:MFS transporter [bacterium]